MNHNIKNIFTKIVDSFKNYKQLIKVERELKYEIYGIKHGGMGADSAYTRFKLDYFAKIDDVKKRDLIIKLLKKMISSNIYDTEIRVKAAWIYADMGFPDAQSLLTDLLQDVYISGSIYRGVIEHALYIISHPRKSNV